MTKFVNRGRAQKKGDAKRIIVPAIIKPKQGKRKRERGGQKTGGHKKARGAIWWRS